MVNRDQVLMRSDDIAGRAYSRCRIRGLKCSFDTGKKDGKGRRKAILVVFRNANVLGREVSNGSCELVVSLSDSPGLLNFSCVIHPALRKNCNFHLAPTTWNRVSHARRTKCPPYLRRPQRIDEYITGPFLYTFGQNCHSHGKRYHLM